jgi:hypothetical protein
LTKVNTGIGLDVQCSHESTNTWWRRQNFWISTYVGKCNSRNDNVSFGNQNHKSLIAYIPHCQPQDISRPLYVFLCFFFWTWYCLSSDLQLLITHIVFIKDISHANIVYKLYFANSTRSPFRNKDNFWAHKTSLFPPHFFYWSACTCTMQGKWAVMYLYVREINIVSFYDFSIGQCNCLDSVVYFILFILYIS